MAALTDFFYKFRDSAPLVLERKDGVDFARCGQMRESEGFIWSGEGWGGVDIKINPYIEEIVPYSLPLSHPQPSLYKQN